MPAIRAFEEAAQASRQTGHDATSYLMTMKPDSAFYSPSWSPGGKHIAVRWATFATASADDSNQLTGQVAIVDVDSGSVTVLDTGAGWADNPSWSPDGAGIAFQRADDTTDFELSP